MPHNLIKISKNDDGTFKIEGDLVDSDNQSKLLSLTCTKKPYIITNPDKVTLFKGGSDLGVLYWLIHYCAQQHFTHQKAGDTLEIVLNGFNEHRITKERPLMIEHIPLDVKLYESEKELGQKKQLITGTGVIDEIYLDYIDNNKEHKEEKEHIYVNNKSKSENSSPKHIINFSKKRFMQQDFLHENLDLDFLKQNTYYKTMREMVSNDKSDSDIKLRLQMLEMICFFNTLYKKDTVDLTQLSQKTQGSIIAFLNDLSLYRSNPAYKEINNINTNIANDLLETKKKSIRYNTKDNVKTITGKSNYGFSNPSILKYLLRSNDFTTSQGHEPTKLLISTVKSYLYSSDSSDKIDLTKVICNETTGLLSSLSEASFENINSFFDSSTVKELLAILATLDNKDNLQYSIIAPLMLQFQLALISQLSRIDINKACQIEISKIPALDDYINSWLKDKRILDLIHHKVTITYNKTEYIGLNSVAPVKYLPTYSDLINQFCTSYSIHLNDYDNTASDKTQSWNTHQQKDSFETICNQIDNDNKVKDYVTSLQGSLKERIHSHYREPLIKSLETTDSALVEKDLQLLQICNDKILDNKNLSTENKNKLLKIVHSNNFIENLKEAYVNFSDSLDSLTNNNFDYISELIRHRVSKEAIQFLAKYDQSTINTYRDKVQLIIKLFLDKKLIDVASFLITKLEKLSSEGIKNLSRLVDNKHQLPSNDMLNLLDDTQFTQFCEITGKIAKSDKDSNSDNSPYTPTSLLLSIIYAKQFYNEYVDISTENTLEACIKKIITSCGEEVSQESLARFTNCNIALGIDYDGCLAEKAHNTEHVKTISTQRLLAHYKNFAQSNINKVEYYNFSMRQTEALDKYNSSEFNNGHYLPILPKLFREPDNSKKISFNKVSFADAYRNKKNNSYFDALKLRDEDYVNKDQDSDNEAADKSINKTIFSNKLNLTYYLSQEIAIQNPNHVHIFCIHDDRLDILEDNFKFYRDHPEHIPHNVIIQFSQTINGNLQSHTLMQVRGQGPIHYNYKEQFKNACNDVDKFHENLKTNTLNSLVKAVTSNYDNFDELCKSDAVKTVVELYNFSTNTTQKETIKGAYLKLTRTAQTLLYKKLDDSNDFSLNLEDYFNKSVIFGKFIQEAYDSLDPLLLSKDLNGLKKPHPNFTISKTKRNEILSNYLEQDTTNNLKDYLKTTYKLKDDYVSKEIRDIAFYLKTSLDTENGESIEKALETNGSFIQDYCLSDVFWELDKNKLSQLIALTKDIEINVSELSNKDPLYSVLTSYLNNDIPLSEGIINTYINNKDLTTDAVKHINSLACKDTTSNFLSNSSNISLLIEYREIDQLSNIIQKYCEAEPKNIKLEALLSLIQQGAITSKYALENLQYPAFQQYLAFLSQNESQYKYVDGQCPRISWSNLEKKTQRLFPKIDLKDNSASIRHVHFYLQFFANSLDLPKDSKNEIDEPAIESIWKAISQIGQLPDVNKSANQYKPIVTATQQKLLNKDSFLAIYHDPENSERTLKLLLQENETDGLISQQLIPACKSNPSKLIDLIKLFKACSSLDDICDNSYIVLLKYSTAYNNAPQAIENIITNWGKDSQSCLTMVTLLAFLENLHALATSTSAQNPYENKNLNNVAKILLHNGIMLYTEEHPEKNCYYKDKNNTEKTLPDLSLNQLNNLLDRYRAAPEGDQPTLLEELQDLRDELSNENDANTYKEALDNLDSLKAYYTHENQPISVTTTKCIISDALIQNKDKEAFYKLSSSIKISLVNALESLDTGIKKRASELFFAAIKEQNQSDIDLILKNATTLYTYINDISIKDAKNKVLENFDATWLRKNSDEFNVSKLSLLTLLQNAHDGFKFSGDHNILEGVISSLNDDNIKSLLNYQYHGAICNNISVLLNSYLYCNPLREEKVKNLAKYINTTLSDKLDKAINRLSSLKLDLITKDLTSETSALNMSEHFLTNYYNLLADSQVSCSDKNKQTSLFSQLDNFKLKTVVDKLTGNTEKTTKIYIETQFVKRLNKKECNVTNLIGDLTKEDKALNELKKLIEHVKNDRNDAKGTLFQKLITEIDDYMKKPPEELSTFIKGTAQKLFQISAIYRGGCFFKKGGTSSLKRLKEAFSATNTYDNLIKYLELDLIGSRQRDFRYLAAKEDIKNWDKNAYGDQKRSENKHEDIFKYNGTQYQRHLGSISNN